MRIIFKIIDIVVTILYFVFVTIGSLLVFPCRLLSIIFLGGSIIMLIDSGISNWETAVPYLLIVVILNFLPSLLSVHMGKALLTIKNIVN